MAAVLSHPGQPLSLSLLENGRMPIFSVVCHSGNVEIQHWGLHFCNHRFQDPHHPWIWTQMALIPYRPHSELKVTVWSAQMFQERSEGIKKKTLPFVGVLVSPPVTCVEDDNISITVAHGVPQPESVCERVEAKHCTALGYLTTIRSPEGKHSQAASHQPLLALKDPTALGGPWKVYGAARRPLPSWFPASFLDEYITFDALNFDDTHNNLSKISHEVTHVFWLALQFHEKEEENIRLNSTMLENVLRSLTSSNSSRQLKHVTVQTGTKQYMGPISDPSFLATHKMIPHEAPFKEDYPRLPFPNFYYALEDLVARYAENNSFSFSIHRSSFIIGPRGTVNGAPFLRQSDERLLAESDRAGVTEKGKTQAFNALREMFSRGKSIWRFFCDIFGFGFSLAFEENGTRNFPISGF
nr:3-oxo-Delta(4,5)-steroid 5-beta-reductase-like [Ipomoea batatas]